MADTPDVGTEITLDQFDADEPQDASKADSSPDTKAEAEPKAEPKVAEKPDKPEPDADAAQADEGKETEGDADGVAEDTKPTKAEERKTQLNTEIRDLVSQRNALKSEVEKANAEVYQPASEAELTEQGLSATDAKVESLRQRIEIRDYNDRVADAQLTISSESERVLNDFPMFNPENKDYDEELAGEAAQLLQSNLILDENTGQIIGSNVSPYQLYKTIARATGISAAKGQIKGQEDTEKMLANADTGSSTAPASKPKDPSGLEALWGADADF